MTRIWIVAVHCAALALCAVNDVSASQITWHIDSSQSYVRLAIPDQETTVGSNSVTVRVRDTSSTTSWTDAGGARAWVEGTIETNFVPGASIEFLSGSHTISSIDDKSLRPNFADWNSGLGAYVGTSSALASYGGRIRGTVETTTIDVGPFAIRGVEYDIASSVLPIDGGGNFAPASTSFSLADGMLGFDITTVVLIVVPDVMSTLSPSFGTNGPAGTIAHLGGNSYKLTYNVSTPIQIILPDLATLDAVASGQIVAIALVPEPASAVLAVLGACGLAAMTWLRRGRKVLR